MWTSRLFHRAVFTGIVVAVLVLIGGTVLAKEMAPQWWCGFWGGADGLWYPVCIK